MAEIQETTLPYPAGMVGVVAFAPVETKEATERFNRDERLTRNGIPLFVAENQMVVIGNKQLPGVTLYTPHSVRTDPMKALVLEGEVEVTHTPNANAYVKSVKKGGGAGANAYNDVAVFASELREVRMDEFAAAQAKLWGQGQGQAQAQQQPAERSKAS